MTGSDGQRCGGPCFEDGECSACPEPPDPDAVTGSDGQQPEVQFRPYDEAELDDLLGPVPLCVACGKRPDDEGHLNLSHPIILPGTPTVPGSDGQQGREAHWFACLVNRPASLGGPAPCDCNVTHGDCPRCPVHVHLCEHVCECAAHIAAGL